MTRINTLLHHKDFTEALHRLNELEADRIYCRHGLSHLLDTARIACLLQYEQLEHYSQPAALSQDLSTKNNQDTPSPVYKIETELIYAAALLHDLGRILQYEQNLPHETAGLPLAKKLLTDCGFTTSEQELILGSIQFHRNSKKDTAQNSLCTLLARADKLSRNCFACPASDTCYWSEDKKNQGILW